MRDLDQELRESLRNRAEDVADMATAPDDLATRVRQRRHRKIAALTSSAAVVALLVGFAGFRVLGDEDASQIVASAPSVPSEIVAQREDGAIVVLSTATGDEVRELVPSGTVQTFSPENYVVSPDGQFLYYADTSDSGTYGRFANGADAELFMVLDASAEQIADVEQRLTADPDVASFHFVDQDEALDDFRETFADDPSLTDTIAPEDLPVSFRIEATAPAAIESFLARFSEIPGVDAVRTRQAGTPTLVADIVRIPTAGGERTKVATGGRPLISPDGSTLARQRPTGRRSAFPHGRDHSHHARDRRATHGVLGGSGGSASRVAVRLGG